MIFVTLGTERYPFPRLLQCVEKAIESGLILDDVLAQTGYTRFESEYFRTVDFLEYEQMVEATERCDLLIGHAGEGTTILALSMGKVPIVVPRRSSLGEHVDDHQIEFARRLDHLGKVLMAFEEEELLDRIVRYKEYCLKLAQSDSSNSRERLIEYLSELCSGK